MGKVSAHDLPIEAQEGLKQADLAVQVLADSDRRIAGLVTAVAAWEHNPGPAAGGPLTTGFHSIQPFTLHRKDTPGTILAAIRSFK